MDTQCVGCGELHGSDRCPNCGAPTAPGGYRVERLLAQTAHSRMFEALAPDGTRVAVKELVFALVPGAQELDAFEREVAVLQGLELPGVPRVLASFREGRGAGTRLYLVQEFVEGTSLAERLRGGPVSESEAIAIARRVLEILQRLHSRVPPVVHRDVKPANLIEGAGGEMVLVDFGSARVLTSEVTYRSTVVGTYGYMPPEQLAGSVDPTADLYALGATLAHLVSGRAPTELMGERLVIEVDGRVPASPRFRRWLGGLLAPSRSKRFRSAAEALGALAAMTAPPPAPGPTPLANRVVLAATVLLVVLGVGALAAIHFAGDALLSPVSQAAPRQHERPPLPPPPVVIARAPPPAEEPPVEVVSLERVLPAGVRAAFWLDSAIHVEVHRPARRRWPYDWRRPVPTRPCSEAPASYISGYDVTLPQDLERVGAMFQLDLNGGGGSSDCQTLPLRLVSDDGEQMQPLDPGWRYGVWIIPRNVARFTLHLGTDGAGLDVGIDLEKRTITLPR